MADRILTSEWIGFDGKKYHEPKSFSLLQPSSQALACEGLIYLIGDLEDGSNIRLNENVDLSTGKLYFEKILAYYALCSISKKLVSEARPSYEHIEAKVSGIKGRINFSKTIAQNRGILSSHAVEFDRLSFNDPLLRFVKSAAKSVYFNLCQTYPDDFSAQVLRSVELVESCLKDANDDSDALSTAIKVTSGTLRFHTKYQHLLPDARILAHFILSDELGMTETNSSTGFQGIMLNLNRPFEKLLTKALQATGRFSHESCQDHPLNKIESVDQAGNPKTVYRMRPDCKGRVDFSGKEHYLLLDAKHKVMATSELDEEDDDGAIDKHKINRSDFYQLISYARTHEDFAIPCFYGLVGLTEEQEETGILVKGLPRVRITFGGESLFIDRLTVNFGAVLIELARSFRDKKAAEHTLRDFGEALLVELESLSLKR